jgi:succinate dehydrogenase / fumarate reductase, cytochrome b subunit
VEQCHPGLGNCQGARPGLGYVFVLPLAPPLLLLSHSLVQKALVALSGLVLVGFTLVHLLGNLLLLPRDTSTYDRLAAALHHWPLLYTLAEVVLAIALITHLGLAIYLARRNRQAHPQDYQGATIWHRGRDRVMVYTGPALAIFLVVHGQHFRWHSPASGHWQPLVSQTLAQPVNFGFYGGMLVVLGFHLHHGIASGLASLGWPKTPALDRACALLAWTVALGFVAVLGVLYWRGQSW